jgi:hypothetical protein
MEDYLKVQMHCNKIMTTMSFLKNYLSVFIYNLCNGAVNSLDYIALNDKMISQKYNGKYVLGSSRLLLLLLLLFMLLPLAA